MICTSLPLSAVHKITTEQSSLPSFLSKVLITTAFQGMTQQSFSLSLYLSLSLSLSLSLTLSLSFYLSLSLSLFLSYSIPPCLKLSPSLCLALALSLPLSLSLTVYLSLYLYQPHRYKHTVTTHHSVPRPFRCCSPCDRHTSRCQECTAHRPQSMGMISEDRLNKH